MGGGWQEMAQGGREGEGQAGTKRHLKRSPTQRGRRESLDGWTRGSGERACVCMAWENAYRRKVEDGLRSDCQYQGSEQSPRMSGRGHRGLGTGLPCTVPQVQFLAWPLKHQILVLHHQLIQRITEEHPWSVTPQKCIIGRAGVTAQQ